MYIYLDSNAVVKEIINDGTIRQGNTQNKVYVYFDSNITIKGCSLALRKNNEGYVIPCSTFDGSLTTSITIPYNKNRDLKYFKEEYPYQMYEFILDADFLANAGTCDAVVQFALADNDILFTSGVIAFIVADNNLSIDVDITLAQLNALANRITSAEIGGDGNFYTETEVDALLNLKQDKLDSSNEGYGILVDSDDQKIAINQDVVASQDDIVNVQEQISELQMEKEDKLISGTTIKTFNGQSLLGSGDIKPREWYYTTSALSWTLQSTTTIELSNLYFISGSSSGIQGTTRIPNVGDFVFYNRGVIGVVQSVNTSIEPYRATIITKWISGAEWTCLEEGTLIRLADGEEKPIEEIRKGDLLASYDFENGLINRAVCIKAVPTTRSDRKDVLIFSNGSIIKCTDNHELYSVETGKNEFVKDLKEGDRVLCDNGEVAILLAKHTEIFTNGEFKQFYTIISSNNCYFANNILNAMHPVNKLNWCNDEEIDEIIKNIFIEDNVEFTAFDFLEEKNDELVSVLNTIKTNENIIKEKKEYLNKTDYVAIKKSEGCEDIDESVIVERANARAVINSCESEIATAKVEYDRIIASKSKIGSDILLNEEERRRKYFKISCKRDNDNLQLFIDKYTSIK